MAKKGILLVKNWKVYLDDDLMTNKVSSMKFSYFKALMRLKYPKIVEKYRLKSYLRKNLKIERVIAWDSVIEDAIKSRIIK